jgi:recombination protein RecA
VAKQTKQGDPLADAMAAATRKWGEGALIRLGDYAPPPVEVISTGSISLDAALGTGGLPRGRVIEVYGPEASGKTTIALHAAASAQRLGLVAAMVDAEHAVDPEYAKRLGVETGALLLSQPDSGEAGLGVVELLVEAAEKQAKEGSPAPLGIIIIDSVSALVPQAEIDGDMGQAHVGLQARLMSQALRKLTAPVHRANIALVFINQLREKVGFVLGNPETTSGGRALKFYASVRLDARGISTIKDGQEPVGRRTRVKVVKNKLASPFKSAEFDILFGLGINREGELLDLGEAFGALRKSGTRYYFGEQALGNGRPAARQALMSEPALAAAVEAEIRKLGQGKLAQSFTPGPGETEPAAGPALPLLPPERGAVLVPPV